MDSIRSSIWRATGSSRCPASVSWTFLLERSRSTAPTDSSNSATRLDSEDWVMCSRVAATLKLPSAAVQ
nr:hypothetical protein [Azohydromonas australica]